MRSPRLPLATTALCAALALVATACTNPAAPSGPGGTETAGDAAAGSTLRLAETNEYESLNPLDHMFGITSKIYDGLYDIGPEGTMVPNLAEGEPEPGADLTRWTVTIRQGVQFHDGTDLTADDVAATYQAIIDPGYGSPLAGTFGVVDDVEALDDSTVEFTLDQPYAPFPSTLTVGIAPSEKLGGTVVDSSLNQEPVGSGPYRLDEWRHGDSLVLTANEQHKTQGQDPAIDRIVIAFVPDENARVQRLVAGEFDGAQVSPRAAQTLAGDDNLTVYTNETADYRGITLPQGVAAFTDPKVRYALNLALDRQDMVDGVLRGYGTPIATPFTPAQGAAYDASVSYAHEPQEAERILDAAGWAEGADGVRAKDGQPLEFSLMYFAEDTLRRDLAMAVASDLEKIGISVDVEAVDRPTAAAEMNDKAFVLGGGDQPYDPDTQVYSMLHSDYAAYDPDDPYSNPSGYSDPDVDALLDSARTTDDPKRRAAMYRQVQQLLHDSPPMLALVVLDHTYVASDLDRYSGVEHVVEPHEHGVAWGPWWNVDRWTEEP